MAIFRTTYTDISKVDRLLYLANSTYFFGIGKDTVWDNSWGTNITEENPPTPKQNTSKLDNILLYKKPIFQTLATESQCGDIQFSSCGEVLGTNLTLINLEETNRETLEVISPNYLYFRVVIEESDLIFANLNSFRIAGLYKDTTFSSLNQIRYLPTSVTNQGKLYWVSYFTPIIRADLVDTFTNITKNITFQILLKI